MALLDKVEQATQTADAAGAANAQTEAGASQSVDSTAAAAATETPAQVAQRALQAHTAQALVTQGKKVNMQVINQLKDALPVDFNTLAQVQANQGKFNDKETKKNLGETVELELLSWQDSWVCSPNDTKAPKELVKYSDDGKIGKDGTDLLEHLHNLKAEGYDKARISQRCVIVGALLAAEKDQSLVGTLIQIDMSPQSRSMFLRYTANAAYQLKIGKLDEDTCKTLVLTATAAKGPDNTDYTRIDFTAKALKA